MKRLALFLIVCLTAVCLFACGKSQSPQYLLVEVTAAGQSECDQMVLDDVTHKVYAYIAMALENGSYDDAVASAKDNLGNIELIVAACVESENAPYDGSVALCDVYKNSRSLGGSVLPKGTYTALEIILGEGKGDTNWTIAYPMQVLPDGSKDIIIKSKIYEIIKEKRN